MEAVKLITACEGFFDESDHFDCSRCFNKYGDRPRTHKEIQKKMHCKVASKSKMASIEYGGIEISFRKCPGNFGINGFSSIVETYQRYQQGVDVLGVPFIDYPAKFVEVMQIVHNLKQRKENEIKEKQLKKHGK